jgi:flavin reductase
MIDIHDFRNGMSMLGSAVSIVTTAHENNNYGMTVSAVCSVTDTPPTLLVCINRKAWSHDFFISSGVLCVNILSSSHEDLSSSFANKSLSMADRFNSHRWSKLHTGAPALDDALVNFDCEINEVIENGSHSVLFAKIREIRMGQPSSGLIYFNRNYHGIPENTL